jgi:hypothetical protein
MKKGGKGKAKSRAGRKPVVNDRIKRNEEKILQMYKDGAIDKDIIAALKIGDSAYYKYLNNNPKFYDKVWELKNIFDVQVVEKSLIKRATGFEYEEVHTEVSEGKNGEQKKSVKRVKKYYPADTTAIIFHLKNRNPDKWRDKQEHDVTIVDLSKIAEDFDKVIGAK